MKFEGSITINKPLHVVARYFADPTYLGEYQEGFLRKENLSGSPGETGAISKMYYKMGKREMVLTETIQYNDLPHKFKAFYHHKHMDNTMTCTFTALDPNKTKYETEVHYTRIAWFLPKLFSLLFPGMMYKKPAERWMKNFKEFVEKQNDQE